MKKEQILKMLLMLLLTQGIFFISCSDDETILEPALETEFGIFEVIDANTIEMDGVINSSSLNNFNQMVAVYPNINTINIVNCDGSEDDETNLQLSALVHQRGADIHILDNGLIASGGTDFFLAGTRRTKGANTRIGVHSWGGQDDDGNLISATDFPVGHEFHQPYIDYYMSVGFTQQEAEDFYYFTINAASPDDIHWMTDEEITQYGLLTE